MPSKNSKIVSARIPEHIEFEIPISRILTSVYAGLKENKIGVNPKGLIFKSDCDNCPKGIPQVEENDPDGEKTPFADVIISYRFHLNKGLNTIRFEVRNSWDYGAGTFKANAPMIDCFYIFAEEGKTMQMDEYYQFLERKGGGN